MNMLRRRSSAKKDKEAFIECELLAEVQNCCSPRMHSGFQPHESNVQKVTTTLLNTSDRGDLEKTLRYLGSELNSDSHQTVMLTLSTIGYLMRVDHVDFHRMLCTVSSAGILKTMQRIIEYRKKVGARREQYEEADFALQLLQCWAETLQGENDTPEIMTLYKDLQRKDWVAWPPRNHTFDVDHTLYMRDGVSVDPSAPPAPRKPASLRPSSLRTFSSEDRSWMKKDFDQFDILLTTLESELGSIKDKDEMAKNALVPDLLLECDKIGPQLRSMIEIITLTAPNDPDALSPLLEMNDRLLRAIDRFHTLEKTEAKKQKEPIQTRKVDTNNPFEDEDLLSEVFNQLGTPRGSSQQQQVLSPSAKSPPARSVPKSALSSPSTDGDLLDFSMSPVVVQPSKPTNYFQQPPPPANYFQQPPPPIRPAPGRMPPPPPASMRGQPNTGMLGPNYGIIPPQQNYPPQYSGTAMMPPTFQQRPPQQYVDPFADDDLL